jgi:hypothetical protein
MNRLFSISSILLISIALMGSSLVQASGGGPAGDEAGDDNMDVYLALGAAAIIGAILIFDVFSGPESVDVAVETVTETPPIISTGVDWDSVIEDIDPLLLAVSVFPASSGGNETASLFIESLTAAHHQTFEVYPDPLNLGLYSPAEEAVLAGEFFSADLFITVREADTGLLLQLYRGTEGPLWSFQTTGTDALTLQQAAGNLAAMLEETGSN